MIWNGCSKCADNDPSASHCRPAVSRDLDIGSAGVIISSIAQADGLSASLYSVRRSLVPAGLHASPASVSVSNLRTTEYRAAQQTYRPADILILFPGRRQAIAKTSDCRVASPLPRRRTTLPTITVRAGVAAKPPLNTPVDPDDAAVGRIASLRECRGRRHCRWKCKTTAG